MSPVPLAEPAIAPQRHAEQTDLPPCPAIVTQLMAEAAHDEPDFPRMGELLSADPALAAALMQTVNSPFYSLVVKANSVQQALLFLGLRSSVRLVTGLALAQAFPSSEGEIAGRIWDSAARFAPMVGFLAQSLGGVDRDEAYTYGLFRDCGQLMLLKRHGHAYAELLEEQDWPHALTLIASEGAQFHADHAHVGEKLAAGWYLPPAICQAVRYHHDGRAFAGQLPGLEPEARTLVALGFLADRLVAPDADPVVRVVWQRWQPALFATLGLGEGDLDRLAEGARAAGAL